MVFKLEVEIQIGQELRAAKRSMDLGIPESRQHCQHIQLKLSKTRVIFVDSMQGGCHQPKKKSPSHYTTWSSRFLWPRSTDFLKFRVIWKPWISSLIQIVGMIASSTLGRECVAARNVSHFYDRQNSENQRSDLIHLMRTILPISSLYWIRKVQNQSTFLALLLRTVLCSSPVESAVLLISSAASSS